MTTSAGSNSFRILSLDGGGVRGAFSAAVLATIEEVTSKRVVDNFDLVTGTSTGGITALALGLGLSAQNVLEFYQKYGAAIFPAIGVRQRWWHSIRRVVAPKFGSAALDLALAAAFGTKLLGESSCRLVIPAYDAVAGDVHVFKTAHDSRVLEDHRCRATEVARATSAAPTYLPLYVSPRGQQFLDGGIWANCPSTVAILEATAVLGVALEDIQLLSIGTTTPAFSIEKQAVGGGLMHYGFGFSIVDLLQQAQAAGAWAQTMLLTKRRAMRIDCTVSPGRFALDDARNLPALIALGRKHGRHHAKVVADQFLGEPAPPFVPHRTGA